MGRFNIPLLLLGLALLTVAGTVLFLRPLASQAVQSPSISLDMVTTGNTYDETTNTMAVGAIDNCLASPTANATTHMHTTHLVIQNVEDLVGWQARLNYDGGQMRPFSVNDTPFTDNNTGQNVSFLNLPIDPLITLHRDTIAAAAIPPAAPGPQTALIGAIPITLAIITISIFGLETRRKQLETITAEEFAA